MSKALKKLESVRISVQRPKKEKITPEECIKRMEAFPEREEAFIAAIKKNKD